MFREDNVQVWIRRAVETFLWYEYNQSLIIMNVEMNEDDQGTTTADPNPNN